MSTGRALTKQQLRELETELIAERTRLERSMEATPGMDGWMPTGGLSVGAIAETQGGLGMALQSRTHARYHAIVDALSRIATGSYGTCVRCERAIPLGRLRVMPEAIHCVACRARS
jgi:DnaK suppressor protein